MTGASNQFEALEKVIGIHSSLFDPVKGLFDGILCAATKIFKSMTNVVTDLLVGAMNTQLMLLSVLFKILLVR